MSHSFAQGARCLLLFGISCAISILPVRPQIGVAAPPLAPTYNRDIRPLLSAHCFSCHGPDSGSRATELRLDQQASAHKYAFVPGQPDASELIIRVESSDPAIQMPPPDSKKSSLSATEIQLLRRWIASGGRYESHWAYISPQPPPIPEIKNSAWASNEIDCFVLSRLQAAGVDPSPMADRPTLIRRVYLDLVGLPPSTVQVDKFVSDTHSDAFQRLVDELIDSPAFGERLASWWFDLVRFANTVGYHGDQEHRITPYRDYVIKSFNDNLPFNQFSIEQIAGDLLPNPTLWQRVASGYNRLLQTTHEGGAQDDEYLAIHQADRVRNFSETWLAGSMGCAQCHDHKFDPYTQRDFYSLAAFFADVDHFGSFEPVGKNRAVDLRPPEIMAWTLPVYNEIQALDVKLQSEQAKLDGNIPVSWQKTQRSLKKLRIRRAELEAMFVPTMVTVATKPREVRILARGDWMDNSGDVVQPATPHFLPPLTISGRRPTRLDLAEWLFDNRNPLTARVVVNRLWKRYFGVGLSKSLLDMGSQGESPPNEPLLDWLAIDFREHGWNIKRLIRQIVTSQAYRQSSQRRPELQAVDPENRLIGRQGSFRLDAEQIRDNALAVSGLLIQKVGGDIVRPYQPEGYYAPLAFPEREYKASAGDSQFRRAVYVHWQRQFPHPWLVAFDAPGRTECTADRMPSNTPSAALVLLNDPTFVEAARALAARVLQRSPHNSDDSRIDWAWRLVLARQPRDDERDELRRLLQNHRVQFTGDKQAVQALASVGDWAAPGELDPAELAAWTSVARTLLNLSETITRN